MSKSPELVLCNLCGEPCNLQAWPHGLIQAKVQGGYLSTPGNGQGALDDLDTYEFSLCEFCLDHLFRQFLIPVKVTNEGTQKDWRPAIQRVHEDSWRTQKVEFAQENARRAAKRRQLDASVRAPTEPAEAVFLKDLSEVVLSPYQQAVEDRQTPIEVCGVLIRPINDDGKVIWHTMVGPITVFLWTHEMTGISSPEGAFWYSAVISPTAFSVAAYHDVPLKLHSITLRRATKKEAVSSLTESLKTALATIEDARLKLVTALDWCKKRP